MLKGNIKAARKAKGLTQEELADELHVVRQTISKWEQGLSVPDAEMLISISKILEIPISTLLGESIEQESEDEIENLSNQLAAINLSLAQSKENRRSIVRHLLIITLILLTLITLVFLLLESPYLQWDYSNPETAVLGVGFHSIEWIGVRLLPLLYIACFVGLHITRKQP